MTKKLFLFFLIIFSSKAYSVPLDQFISSVEKLEPSLSKEQINQEIDKACLKGFKKEFSRCFKKHTILAAVLLTASISADEIKSFPTDALLAFFYAGIITRDIYRGISNQSDFFNKLQLAEKANKQNMSEAVFEVCIHSQKSGIGKMSGSLLGGLAGIVLAILGSCAIG